MPLYFRRLPWGPRLPWQWIPTIRSGGRYGRYMRVMLLIRFGWWRLDVKAWPTRRRPIVPGVTPFMEW